MDPQPELRTLVERYAMLVDERRFEGLSTVFTDDAVLTTGNGIRAGLEAIVDAMQGLHRYVETRHEVGASSTAVDGDRATGTVECSAHHLDAAGTDRVMTITYHDEYVSTPAGWRIQQRTLEIHTDEIHTDQIEPA